MYTPKLNEGGVTVSLIGETPNELRAVTRIERAVANAATYGRSIPRDIARIVASIINNDAGGPLASFAATGHLRADDAHAELCNLPFDLVPVPWWRAMDCFLDKEAKRVAA